MDILLLLGILTVLSTDKFGDELFNVTIPLLVVPLIVAEPLVPDVPLLPLLPF